MGRLVLKNLEGALIILAVHSHGPALTGQALKGQISFLPGWMRHMLLVRCQAVFAAGPSEVPVAGWVNALRFRFLLMLSLHGPADNRTRIEQKAGTDTGPSDHLPTIPI